MDEVDLGWVGGEGELLYSIEMPGLTTVSVFDDEDRSEFSRSELSRSSPSCDGECTWLFLSDASEAEICDPIMALFLI